MVRRHVFPACSSAFVLPQDEPVILRKISFVVLSFNLNMLKTFQELSALGILDFQHVDLSVYRLLTHCDSGKQILWACHVWNSRKFILWASRIGHSGNPYYWLMIFGNGGTRILWASRTQEFGEANIMGHLFHESLHNL